MLEREPPKNKDTWLQDVTDTFPTPNQIQPGPRLPFSCHVCLHPFTLELRPGQTPVC